MKTVLNLVLLFRTRYWLRPKVTNVVGATTQFQWDEVVNLEREAMHTTLIHRTSMPPRNAISSVRGVF